MKNNIRTKLFVGLSLFTCMIVGLSWVLNTKYLENYYMKKKRESLIQYGKEIEHMFKNHEDHMDNEIERIENTIGGNITIYNPYFNHRGGMGFSKMGMGMFLSNKEMKEVLEGKRILETFLHPKFKVKFLVHAIPLEGDNILILQTSIGAIKESVEIGKGFHVYIGMLALGVGMFLAIWLSKTFTKPIVELNRVAKSMAKLDFSKKYEVKANDEIGQLGETINYLSNTLNHTISELNEANEKLKEDIERKRKIDLMRKEFISSVSHELKTPIALIQGYAEGLKEKVAEDEESQDFYCEVIIDEAEKMGKMVKDLLELSQMESKNTTIQREVFHIDELVEKTYKKYKSIFNDRDIKATLKKSNKNVEVMGDPSKIEQVLVNFINNGIHHIGGEKNINIYMEDHKGKVRIGVYNTGDFIREEEMKKIWGSFYKIDKSRTREYGGTGLGLAIVKSILNLHHSNFGVINRNDGVEFWFELKKYL
ncbi:MAG: cell wall metabolism sensor histidine kinase WalK [Anaeromicrobium sp.]|jgi:signal transduction histidine kinase|uniref:sensor histidine kinase n=1 Tax=Anaeromicrobium sp. TaxID=1929132 RepID=UPI0025F7DC35|nr:HAMP domain-containing sensor histidine kinase [Anaeromicrobium sp.]MCT4593473.1 cell wall metabolism sensor histidine kinase WalK [Anaeromicrobium sp.]